MLKSIADFLFRHTPLCVATHIWITAGLILTGPNYLEPLAATWFWAPILTTLLAPDRYNRWVGAYFRELFFVSWLLSVTVLPWLLWDFLCYVDNGLHAARETIGQAAHLGGQTGLVVAVSSLLTAPLIVLELRQVRRRRSART